MSHTHPLFFEFGPIFSEKLVSHSHSHPLSTRLKIPHRCTAYAVLEPLFYWRRRPSTRSAQYFRYFLFDTGLAAGDMTRFTSTDLCNCSVFAVP